jgi:signal recognition particle receptor subunit beta
LADTLTQISNTSKKRGMEAVDLSLLTDGLQAEREQGITIDVAYRYFSTGTRKYIIADAPGHEQYTRNMVTAASTANLAIILIDARKGVLTQTRRHSYLAHLVGIPHIVVAVNKMDLVNYDQAIYNKICADYLAFAKEIGLQRNDKNEAGHDIRSTQRGRAAQNALFQCLHSMATCWLTVWITCLGIKVKHCLKCWKKRLPHTLNNLKPSASQYNSFAAHMLQMTRNYMTSVASWAASNQARLPLAMQ